MAEPPSPPSARTGRPTRLALLCCAALLSVPGAQAWVIMGPGGSVDVWAEAHVDPDEQSGTVAIGVCWEHEEGTHLDADLKGEAVVWVPEGTTEEDGTRKAGASSDCEMDLEDAAAGADGGAGEGQPGGTSPV